MKKILSLFVLVAVIFALVACDSAISNTKVRVVGLSYSSTETTLAATPSNSLMRLNSNKLLSDEVDEYISHGEVLVFTVELEDSNFEFSSLLSIKLNDVIIRAGVDNSIASTRDCGGNICVDFPFEITADKFEYTVQEVKFAKENIEGGVNAIIDTQSAITVALDDIIEDLFPYVLESVQTLNNVIQNIEYFENGATLDLDTWNLISYPVYSDRLFYISNYSGTKDLDNLRIEIPDFWRFNVDTGDSILSTGITQEFVLSYKDYEYYDLGDNYSIIYGPYFCFSFFESKFRNAYFYSEMNSIYLNLLGEKYFIIQLHDSSRIMYFQP